MFGLSTQHLCCALPRSCAFGQHFLFCMQRRAEATPMAAKHIIDMREYGHENRENRCVAFIIIIFFSRRFSFRCAHAFTIMARRLFMTLVALFYFHFFCSVDVVRFTGVKFIESCFGGGCFMIFISRSPSDSMRWIVQCSMCACDVLKGLSMCARPISTARFAGTYHNFTAICLCAFIRDCRYQLVAIVGAAFCKANSLFSIFGDWRQIVKLKWNRSKH